MSSERKEIKLSRPISVNGSDIDTLNMREPTVSDQLAADRPGASDSEKEIAMIANLCEQAHGDIKKLTLRDYKKVQEAFVSFVE